MGMDPFNFADALLGILAQRLAKRLCPVCKSFHVATEEEISTLVEEYGADLFNSYNEEEKEVFKKNTREHWFKEFGQDDELLIYEAVGCDECNSTGYEGRLALHELLVTSREIKKLIQERGTVAEITKVAYEQGMVTLKQDGIEKIFQGYTDIHQVRAVCIK